MRRKRDTGDVVYYMDHQNQITFHLFTSQEVYSSHGKYSQKLRATMIDRARRSGYVTLPGSGNHRAAEVYNGGPQYKYSNVYTTSVISDKDAVKLKNTDVPRPARPATPLSEKDRTENLIEYLEDY